VCLPLHLSHPRNIKDNSYEFPEHDPVSPEAKDLITSLLHPDPTNRPSIDLISDHKFFHSGLLPRSVPTASLVHAPTFPSLSIPASEVNWRYICVQSGLGENVRVGADVGKSVQVCLSAEEHPLKGAVARLREGGNVLPMTLSPRVPAPQVGGLFVEGGAKRSIRKVSSEDDKENLLMKLMKSKGTRKGVQQVFPEEKGTVRSLPAPIRKMSVSRRPEERLTGDGEIGSGAKRTLREPEPVVRLPTKAELNVPSRVPVHIQAQRAALKSSTRDATASQLSTSTRALRSRGIPTKVDSMESKIPTLTKPSTSCPLVDILRSMGDNLTLALTSPSNRLSSQFRPPPTQSPC
jgi:serine/threonine protein kinase